MGQISLPKRMSIPELMGDPCAANLREHAEAILAATASSSNLTRDHPDVADEVQELQEHVHRLTSSVLGKLADAAGLPSEGESVSRAKTRAGDYRVDRSSECWIWMRALTGGGYPVSGRKVKGKENLPAKIYWMLENGPIEPDEIVVRTCGMRLCVNPAHGRVVDRAEYGAQQMRERSSLDWDAVRVIRTTMCSSHREIRTNAAGLASELGISEHSVMEVFRNKVWFDRNYEPGCELMCAGPGCGVVFRTTSAIRRYHSRECGQAAAAARDRGSSSHEVRIEKSPERLHRETLAMQAETEAAEREWAEAVPEDPRTSVWSVASLDQPIADGGGELGDLIADGAHRWDPELELERKEEKELLTGLTEDKIAAMGEGERRTLQERLKGEGIVPSTSGSARE